MTTDEKPNFETCFAYNSALENSCAVLSEKLCTTRGKCPFFKTQLQFDVDAAMADKSNKGNWLKGVSHNKSKKVHNK